MGLIFVVNRQSKNVWLFILSLTVEPISFLNLLAFTLFSVAQQSGLYEVICYQTFSNGQNDSIFSYHNGSDINESTVDCKKLRSFPHAEIKVQELASNLNMFLSLVHILPAIVAHIFLGAWSDKHGRKINILIGIIGLIINTIPFVVLFEIKSMPLWILYITGFISGCTGYIGIIMMSSFAYLADVTDKENLTVRVVIFVITMALAGIVGSFLAAGFLKYIRLSYICIITICILLVAFIYSLRCLKQIPPAVMKKMMSTKKDDGNRKDEPNVYNEQKQMQLSDNTDKALKEKVTRGINEVGYMLVEVWRTYTKPRQNRQRLYLLLIALTFFINLLAQMSMHISQLYVFRSPISWKPEQFALWKATHSILTLLGTLLGALVFKKIFKLQETSIMLIALLSDVCHNLIIAFANNGWMLYLSITLGCLAPLFMPTMQSFITQTVEADELGKALVIFGLAMDVCQALSSILSNALYQATVSFFPGFLFLFCSGILAIALGIVLFIKIDSAKFDKLSKAFDYKKSESQVQLKDNAVENVDEQK